MRPSRPVFKLAVLAAFAAGAALLLSSCETNKPRGPQPKSSLVGWDHATKGQGAGAMGGFLPQQGGY